MDLQRCLTHTIGTLPNFQASSTALHGPQLLGLVTPQGLSWLCMPCLAPLQITFSLQTCPFPASEAFPATIISRNLTVASLSPAALAAAAAAGASLPPGGAAAQLASAARSSPFWIDCQHLDGRFQLQAGHTFEFRDVVLVGCRWVRVRVCLWGRGGRSGKSL